MTTYPTLDAARADLRSGTLAIAYIAHRDVGNCYVQLRCSLGYLRVALRIRPVPEIVQLIAEYPPMDAAAVKEAERDRIAAAKAHDALIERLCPGVAVVRAAQLAQDRYDRECERRMDT